MIMKNISDWFRSVEDPFMRSFLLSRMVQTGEWIPCPDGPHGRFEFREFQADSLRQAIEIGVIPHFTSDDEKIKLCISRLCDNSNN